LGLTDNDIKTGKELLKEDFIKKKQTMDGRIGDYGTLL
jgi:hypothetical protein